MSRLAAICAAVIFLGVPVVVMLLPATLAKRAVDQLEGVDAIRFNGTLWHGQSLLILQNGPTANLRWQLQDLTHAKSTELFGLQPKFDWTLQNSDFEITGTIGLRRTSAEVKIAGDINSSALAPLLNRFDIFLSGDFTLAPGTVLAPYRTASLQQVTLVEPVDLLWSGGQVSYILSGQFNQVDLPSLQAKVTQTTDQTLIATVQTVTAEKLLDIVLRTNGVVVIRLNRRFLDLLAYPWPGEQDPEDIVIEVERRIL